MRPHNEDPCLSCHVSSSSDHPKKQQLKKRLGIVLSLGCTRSKRKPSHASARTRERRGWSRECLPSGLHISLGRTDLDQQRLFAWKPSATTHFPEPRDPLPLDGPHFVKCPDSASPPDMSSSQRSPSGHSTSRTASANSAPNESDKRRLLCAMLSLS